MITPAQITAERRSRQRAEMTETSSSVNSVILETLRMAEHRLSGYEYSPENLEFLTDPHQIAMDEALTDEEVGDSWNEIAASLMLTPEWCLEARIKHTFAISGDRFETFRQLLPRLSQATKEKFKAIGVAYAPRNEFDKYADFTATV
ncbi:hypothetical protein SAMD00079811_83240 (plasmid) [Scytonema sp. HK-05]|nr:hypothetical protein SAMD00079811_83240 [Scytonema sp. HK-05]